MRRILLTAVLLLAGGMSLASVNGADITKPVTATKAIAANHPIRQDGVRFSSLVTPITAKYMLAKRDDGCGMCQHDATYGCYTGAYIPCLSSGNTQQNCYKILSCCEYDYGAENCPPCTWVSVADAQCSGN